MPAAFRRTVGIVALALTLAGTASTAEAWGHQGHILITRLAALRIISDPASPPALVEFLKANMKYDMEACKKLATAEMVGGNADNYKTGLDGACTLPDRIIFTEEGKKNIEPYGAPEAKMHFMDMEWLGKDPSYKPDLSNRPKISDISSDIKDPRWKMAGFAPFRVEECYKKTVAEFSGDKIADPKEALHWVGYLCHYIEDCHQPLHATIDYKSFSYLVGKVKQVHEVKTETADGIAVDYRVDARKSRTINPHGDLEFQLFENADEPRKTWRMEFWNELVARIEVHAKAAATQEANSGATKLGTFKRTLEILSDSYDYLPAVGKAAQAGYASGKFDARAFFTSEDTVHGEKMSIIQLIAERNAAAVIEVERTLRQAWAEAHRK